METQLKAEIRPLLNDDLAAVARIEKEQQFSPWSETLFAETLTVPRYFSYVLTDAQRVIGFYVAEVITTEASLHNIAVDSSYQGQGLGRQLLGHMLKQCQNSGVVQVFLEVRDSNLKAIELYRSVGFELDGVRKDYYTAPWGREDGQLMSLRLVP